MLLSAGVPLELLGALRWRSHGSLARLYCGSFGEFRSTRVSVCVVAADGDEVVFVVMLGFVAVSGRVTSPCGEAVGEVVMSVLFCVVPAVGFETAGWVMSILSGDVPAVGLAPLVSVVVEMVVEVVLEPLWLESADHGLVELLAVAELSVGAMLEVDDELG